MDEARMERMKRIVDDMQGIVLSVVVIGAMRYQDRSDGDDVCGGCRRCEDVMVMTRFASLPSLFLLDRPSTRVSGREVTLCRWKGMTILCLVVSGKEMLSSTFHSLRYTYSTQHWTWEVTILVTIIISILLYIDINSCNFLQLQYIVYLL